MAASRYGAMMLRFAQTEPRRDEDGFYGAGRAAGSWMG
jgi:hypothetical protein